MKKDYWQTVGSAKLLSSEPQVRISNLVLDDSSQLIFLITKIYLINRTEVNELRTEQYRMPLDHCNLNLSHYTHSMCVHCLVTSHKYNWLIQLYDFKCVSYMKYCFHRKIKCNTSNKYNWYLYLLDTRRIKRLFTK